MKKGWMLIRVMIVLLITGVVVVGFTPAVQSETPKVQKWQPSSWLPSGITWDTIGYISEYVKRMSNGRLVMTPSAPGAIVPVAEQLNPVGFMHGDCFAAPRTTAELRYLYESYEDGKIMKLLREEYAKHGVHLVGNLYWTLDNLMISKVPIRGIEDIKGKKFRSSELIALQLAHHGAGTIWTPGGEIYTMLATGGVDAITFSHAADMVAMGFHEVTKYWIKFPTAVGPAADALIVNMDVWKALPDDLKAIVEAAVEVGSGRNAFEAELAIAEAWKFVEKHGIEVIEWSEEDARKLAATAKVVVPKKYLKNPAFAEIFKIVGRWAAEKGYW
jgi:TRAP-type mannitol/chloroaromatic compound transport system substrate-binding protein